MWKYSSGTMELDLKSAIKCVHSTVSWSFKRSSSLHTTRLYRYHNQLVFFASLTSYIFLDYPLSQRSSVHLERGYKTQFALLWKAIVKISGQSVKFTKSIMLDFTLRSSVHCTNLCIIWISITTIIISRSVHAVYTIRWMSRMLYAMYGPHPDAST